MIVSDNADLWDIHFGSEYGQFPLREEDAAEDETEFKFLFEWTLLVVLQCNNSETFQKFSLTTVLQSAPSPQQVVLSSVC